MPDEGLPCLEILAATPEILRALMCELSEEDARWKPAPSRFSVAEVLAHLSHGEGHCYRLRIDRMLAEDRPVFEDFDAKDYLDLYTRADPEDSFDHFEEQRESNLEFLHGLEEDAGRRVGVHPETGEFTLTELLHSWVLHDLGHVRQVAELVRARKYLPGAGALGRYHESKP
jgi:hypothetical protein